MAAGHGRAASRPRPIAILLAAIAAALAVTVALSVGSAREAASPSTQAPQALGTPGTAPSAGGGAGRGGQILAVAAENQYGDVIAQVGGPYVTVRSLLSNPNTDPHTFEASAAVAREVGAARLVVQNGLGYDSFMNTIETASPNGTRMLITVQHLLNLPDTTPNPHLWYSTATMPAVADAVAADLAKIDPAHAAYFRASAAGFTASLRPWYHALAVLKKDHPGVPVATTEPVADYFLAAAGAVNKTPWAFQADVMNGVDPSPQDVAAVRALLTGKKVAALVYNVQVTDQLTGSFIALARQHGVPVVGVYETMPQPGYRYQSWMLAEASALSSAISARQSTERL